MPKNQTYKWHPPAAKRPAETVDVKEWRALRHPVQQRFAANPVLVHLGDAGVQVDDADRVAHEEHRPEWHSRAALHESEPRIERVHAIGRHQREREIEYDDEIKVIQIEAHAL